MTPEERASKSLMVYLTTFHITRRKLVVEIADAIREAVAESDAEVARLRGLVASLAERVHAQSELLARRAEHQPAEVRT